MKRVARHLTGVLAGAAIFHGIGLFVPVSGPFEARWYKLPFDFPLIVAESLGTGPHNWNATAGYMTWAAECFLFGTLGYGLMWMIWRSLRSGTAVAKGQAYW